MSDDRLADLYHDALELDPEGRRLLLERLAGEAPALSAELGRLLATPAASPSPIDASPALAEEVRARSEAYPERVGPYRLLRELGQGGMGRVFLAEQATADFRRNVALKLIDAGRFDDGMVRRFREEVRILASLDHPWIVRFLDGGQSPEGIWYLALEHIEGRDLLSHANVNGLETHERVRLLLPVMEAVDFAHQRGIVHRDIKPSNVLVDRQGRPRLLDFGISKLWAPETAGGQPSTLGAHQTLTPAYASPEQLAGEPASPASDVYSLGVVLYELLVGRRPFAFAPPAGSNSTPLPPSAAARDTRPPKPAANADDPAAIGRSARGRRGLDADLDAICLKALASDPAARYGSAADLAADLRRYLDGQPVLAHASAGGRLFGSRSKSWLLAAGLLLALAAGLIVATRALRHEPAAGPAAAGGFPYDPTNPPPATDSERRLVEAPDDMVAGSALILRLAKDNRIGEARIALGRMRQVPGKELDPLLDFADGRLASMDGEDQRALVLFTRARDNALAEGRAELLGAVRTSRASTLMKLGQTEAALTELQAARLDSERAGDDRTLYRTLNGIALETLQRGEIASGRQALEDALAAARRAGIEPVTTMENLAVLEANLGRPDRAEPLAREILAIRIRDKDAPNEGEILKTLSVIVRDLGRSTEAAPLLERAVTLLEQSKRGNVLADSLWDTGKADLEDGRLDRIDGLAERLEKGASARLTPLAIGYAHSLAGGKAALTGDLDTARRRLAEARRLILSDGYPDLAAMSDLWWAEAEARAGDLPAAERVLSEALAELAQPEATVAGFFAATQRARYEAAGARYSEARQRLATLGEGAAESPSVSRRIAFLAARGAVAGEERRGAGDSDLDAAIALAKSTGRKVDELEIRIDRQRVTAGGPSWPALEALADEADSLGLAAIAARARGLATTVPPIRRP